MIGTVPARNLACSMMYKTLIVLTVLSFNLSIGNVSACGKELDTLKHSIADTYDRLAEAEEEDERTAIDSILQEQVSQLTQCDRAFYEDFDALSERIGILSSPDSVFRLFHWNVLHENGTHSYSGFILHRDVDGRISSHQLNSDQNASERDKKRGGPRKEVLERKKLEAGDWIPALYYRIIPKERDGETFYTLLGWEGKDQYSTRKTIETLSFDKNGKPRFGLPVFRGGPEEKAKKKKKREIRRDDRLDRFDLEERRAEARKERKRKGPARKQRVIFEFTNDAVLTLNYEKKKDRIVFNQLVPERPDLEGIYEFYSPDLLFDAYVWKDEGFWEYKKEVEPENKDSDRRPWNDPEE